jgi:ligand-binding sensor domain-containing protein/signal transduction histidine kinase
MSVSNKVRWVSLVWPAFFLLSGQARVDTIAPQTEIRYPAKAAPKLSASHLRPSVHPRRNVEDFPAVAAKFVRFRILHTNGQEPCLDELEIYPEDEPRKNVGLASAGGRATASGTLPGYVIHQVGHVNDGLYGNGQSWIGDKEQAWVQIELPQVQRISQVVWGRDREGNFIDRLATDYVLEVSTNGSEWQTVASSADREPLGVGNILTGISPLARSIERRLAPVSTTLSAEQGSGSPDYRIDRWQTEDGLPGNTVSSIVQTQDGYLWVGTFGGLARFDGIRFETFGEDAGLKNERILCLCADREGNLWVGSEGGGLFCFRDGKFSALTTRDGLLHNIVMSLAQDNRGRLWIGTYAGLQCRQDGEFVPPAAEPTPRGQVSRLLADRAGRIWMVINGRLAEVETNHFSLPAMQGEPSGSMAMSALHDGKSGRFWLGGSSGYVAASHDGVVSVLNLGAERLADSVWEVWEARNGDVWIGTASSGLRRWRNGQVLSLTTQEGLADNSIRCIYEDREGNLWIGTNGGGLHRLKPKKLTLVTSRDGLSHNVIMSLAEDGQGELWIGSNGGGLTVCRNGVFAPAYLNYLLDNESIGSLLAEGDDGLWIGTWSSGLFHKSTGKLERFRVARPGTDEPVLALCMGHDGGLWVGTYQDGLKFFKDGEFTSYRTTNGVPSNLITALVQDADGRLWIGTDGGGLACLVAGKFSVFTRRGGLASDFIRSLYIDRQNVLWIGTGGGGLSRMKEGRLATVNAREGLMDDVISQILEDDQGHLWFGSHRGIFRASKNELNRVADGDAKALKVISFGKAEGMENLECTGGFCPAGLKTRDGKLWFSTVKGLVMIDPKNIPGDGPPPPVVIERVIVDGAVQTDPAVAAPIPGEAGAIPPAAGVFRIAPGAKRIEIHYTALGFVAPEKIRFRYRLDGLDSEWVEAGSRRVAEFSHLPPALYQFRVTACNEDSDWDPAGATLALDYLPLFWQTWWFRLSIALAVAGCGGWAVKYWFTRRLRRRLAWLSQEHSLEKERTRIARDIHDEIGTGLTEIILLSELGRKHRERPQELEKDLRQIANAARETVRNADAIVWAVNPRNDSLDGLANYIVGFAEDFFRLTPIRCRVDVPTRLPQATLSGQARHHLLLAVKETCNNVVRHSEATEVWLRVASENHHFTIAIEDNGKGFSGQAASAGSDGLFNIRQRMEELGGDLEVTSSSGNGTNVKLIVGLTERLPCPERISSL